VNQNKIKQVFMLDLSQAQDKRKSIGTINDANVIKKSYSDIAIAPQNILVSSLNSNISTVNSNNITQQSHPQQFSLVHQKPIILGASTSGGTGTFIQSSSTGNTTNKIIVTPASGNIYMGPHGKLVLPSSNSQGIILDSKMMSTNQASSQSPQAQQKLQANQQRVKMENKVNMLIESTGEKNIIYAKYNKNKIFQTNIIPVQTAATTGANKTNSQSVSLNQGTKQISSISSTQAQQQPINVIANNKSLQRITTTPFSQQSQQQQQILRPQYGTSTVNFQNSNPASKIIQQSNNGNNILSNDNSSTSPR
jgi:hypothetical protein